MEEGGSIEAIIPFFYITSVLGTVYRQTSIDRQITQGSFGNKGGSTSTAYKKLTALYQIQEKV